VTDIQIAERRADEARLTLASLVVERPWHLVIWMAMVAWSAILFATVRSHFNEFRMQRFDLGNMVQAVWSTANGRPLETTFHTGEQLERLAGHVDPFLALLAPLWIVAPSPLMLAAVQVAACALGALPVYWLGRRHLASDRAAGLLAVAYLAYPWLAWTALDAIHPVTFAIPLFLFSIWFLDSDRLLPFAVAAMLAAATGELMGLSIAGLGLWYWLARGHRRAGIGVFGAGFAWTLICVKVIVPAFAGRESQFYAHYTEVGGSPEGVLRTVVTQPGVILAALTSPADIGYVIALAVPLAGALFLAPGIAIAATPALAAIGLSSFGALNDPRQHYIAGVIPFFFAATVFGLARLPARKRAPAAGVVLAFSVLFSVLLGPWPGPGETSWLQRELPADRVTALREAIAMVPDDAPVAATNRAGSHLSERRYFYSVPLVERADWVVLDTNDVWVPLPPPKGIRSSFGRRAPELMRTLVANLASSKNWSKVFDRSGVLVFRRVQAGRDHGAARRPLGSPYGPVEPTVRPVRNS
jgi:uncharacterized membrane protein